MASRSRRSRIGAKRVDTQMMRAMIGQQQMTTSLGVVRKFPGETSHFDIDTENGTAEVLVDVELIPSGTRVQCRLGFGNPGVYSIPKENAEVAVLIPYDPSSLIKDSLDFEPIIVGVLDANAPTQLTGPDLVVVKASKVQVISSNIELGDAPNINDGVVVGTGIDTFSGSPYWSLGSTSSTTKAKK
jgi:hypothetical protein